MSTINAREGWAIQHRYGISIDSVASTRVQAWCKFIGRERRDPQWKRSQRWWYRYGCRAVKVRMEAMK